MGTAGSKKAGRKATYIDEIAVRMPRDKFRAALGRFWAPGSAGAKYGADIPASIAPFYASVGSTSTARQTTDCPFIARRNSISVTPNPAVFGAGSGASAKDSFATFLYGGEVLARDFTPYWNLNRLEFGAFCKLFEIRTAPGTGDVLPDDYIRIPGILNFCGQPLGPPTPTDPPDVDPPDIVAALVTDSAIDIAIGELPEDYYNPIFSPPAAPGDSGHGIGDLLVDRSWWLEGEGFGGDDSGGEIGDAAFTDPADEETGGPETFFPDDVEAPTPGTPLRAPRPDCCDTTFDIMTPFPPAAMEYFEAQNNVVFSGLTFSYNYTNDVYNIFAADPEVEEKDLPNLYATLTDGNAGRFLRTAKSKVPCDSDVHHLLETTTGHKHLMSTADTTLKLGAGAPYSEFFPYHADLQFTTDRDAEFGDALARRRMDGIMLRRFAQGPDPGNFCEPPPAGARRSEEKTVNMGLSTQVIEADVSSKSVRVKGNYGKAVIKEIDFCDWFNKTENCVVAMETPSDLNKNARFIRPTPATDPGSIDSADIALPALVAPMEAAAQAQRYAEFGMLRSMASEHANRNFGGYRQLLETGVNYSETIAYKVLKWDAETYKLSKADPAGSYEALQEIYFSNTQKLDAIHYIDTQVKYNKGYVYEVRAFEMVLGTKYKYQPIPCTDGWIRRFPLPTGELLPYIGPAATGGTPPPDYVPWIRLTEILLEFESGRANYDETQDALHDWLNTYSSLPEWGYFAGTGTMSDCGDRDIGVRIVGDWTADSLEVIIGCPCNSAAVKGFFGKKGCDDDASLPALNIDVMSRPCIKIYEVPYFIQQGRLLEHPPVRPLVDLIPYRSVNNQMLINLSNGMGVESQIPIYINPGEQLVINERLKTENYIRQKIDYRSHPGGLPPSGFEIYRMTDPPKNYQDFAGHLRAFVSTDFDKVSRQAADAASFVDDMVPNQKYYYIFRTIGDLGTYDQFGEYTDAIASAAATQALLAADPDPLSATAATYTADLLAVKAEAEKLVEAAGTRSAFSHLFSNPTPIYEVELVDDDGAVYLLIRTVDFDILHPPPTHRTMKRLIHVKPNITQSIVNPRYAEETTIPVIGTEFYVPPPIITDEDGDGEPDPGTSAVFFPGYDRDILGAEEPKFSSASDALLATGGKILLGADAKSVWGKTYKVRLTSKKTCRKLDLNVRFKVEHIDNAQCHAPTIVGVPFDAEEEVP